MSLIGATSMALALLVGCGDDDAKPVSSQLGQSCVRTADCAEGLSCIANACYKSSSMATAGAGGGAATPTPPVLGEEGESCTSRLDCQSDLHCFNNRCAKGEEPTGGGGDAGSSGGGVTTPPGVVLGSRGESCVVNSDCDKTLVCVPTAGTGTGVCDLANFGIKPTGMTCSGECTGDSDCYQLPVALQTVDVKSCPDIEDKIAAGPIDCTAPASQAENTLCFYEATYCNYNKKTSKVWTCDGDTNRCVYNVACDPLLVGTNIPDGCPSNSRLNDLSALTCNTDSKKCVGAAAPVGCTTDAKCEGEQIADGADLCTADECTCYTKTKRCYRKCSQDIECATGRVCDTDTNVCVPSDTCSTDSECAIQHNNVGFKCDAGKCAQTCTVDRDCSGSGLNSVFNGLICVSGFCESVAADCQSSSECTAAAGALKPFCVPTSKGAVGVFSAITN